MKMKTETYHIPVLLNETLELLNINPEGIYVDLTFGGGGHSKEILKKLTTGKLIAFDKDPDAEKEARKITANNFIFIRSSYANLAEKLSELNIDKVDGILADLGVSSHQLDATERGFSFKNDAVLDMRMDKEQNPHSAYEILNKISFYDLAYILKKYGELPRAKRFARAIIEYRENLPLSTTGDLVKAVKPFINPKHEKKTLAKLFQAIRIHVNNEIEELKQMLLQSVEVLKPQGRIVVISYHSLEDRPVKRFFKAGNFSGEPEKDFYGNPIVPFKLITKKPIVPTEEEINKNPRSRSAKLRCAEKI